MPDGKLYVHPGRRPGVDATVVIVFDEGDVGNEVEVMDVTFQPPGDTDRGAGLLADLVAGGNLLMAAAKRSGGGA